MFLESLLQLIGYEDTLYVARYVRQLRNIAKQLRREGHRVWPRLNYESRCVELRTRFGFGGLFAKINVHGSEGAPFKAVITSTAPMLPIERLVFEKTLPVSVEFNVETWLR